MKRAAWIRLGILSVLATLLVAIFVFLPLKTYHARFVEHVEGMGPLRFPALCAIFVGACLLMIPVTPISLASGMLFGFWQGLLTIAVGTIIGPALTYFVGRFLGRRWVASALAKNSTLCALDRAVAAEGFKIICLARLSPFVPFGVLNYMLSLSRVPFLVFLAATFVGVLPSTIAYSYLGSLAGNLDELIETQRKGGLVQSLLFWGGLAATVAVSIVITMVAKKALRHALGKAAVDIPATLPEVVHAMATAVSGTEPQDEVPDANVAL